MAEKKGFSTARDREEEEEREFQDALEEKILKSRLEGKGKKLGLSQSEAAEMLLLDSGGPTEKLMELLSRVEPLIEQVHVLYTQYFFGVERQPPLARRHQLDQVMQTLTLMPKATQALQFRFRVAQARYRTYSEQWERKLKELEAGKIARKLNRG